MTSGSLLLGRAELPRRTDRPQLSAKSGRAPLSSSPVQVGRAHDQEEVPPERCAAPSAEPEGMGGWNSAFALGGEGATVAFKGMGGHSKGIKRLLWNGGGR